jgi:hypothetical protein
MPYSSLKTNDSSINASDCLVQTLGVGFYLADFIHIYSTVEIQETKAHEVYFDPFRGDFLIGGSVYFKNLSIGVLHECNHDIVTNMSFHDYNGWEAGINKAYINYTMPITMASGISITPSITLGDQFTEKIRIKSNDEQQYFKHTGLDISPNVLFSEFGLAMEFFCLRSRLAFQMGYTLHNNERAYTQLRAGVELFYRSMSLGLDYINRRNMQDDAGYSLKGLTVFVRFQGISGLM